MIDLDADAVLFDLDGTLVDSSASVLRAWYRVAAALAIPFAEFEPYVHGIPAPDVFALVAPDLAPADVRDMTEQMLAAQALDRDVQTTPGALAALAAVPANRWAIVTSGDRRLASARIAAAGLPVPQILVTSDDVDAGKPDPACYLLAAVNCGVEPRRCLVIEDAPAGVAASARRAPAGDRARRHGLDRCGAKPRPTTPGGTSTPIAAGTHVVVMGSGPTRSPSAYATVSAASIETVHAS